MTYEERKAEAMSMTLEELIFNYHRAVDTAENRNATIISLQYLLDERHLQIEALYDTIQGLTDGRDKLKTEVKPEPISSVEVWQWKLRRRARRARRAARQARHDISEGSSYRYAKHEIRAEGFR